jgi:hypothetical protein
MEIGYRLMTSHDIRGRFDDSTTIASPTTSNSTTREELNDTT